MAETLAVYRHLVGARLRARTQYRASFVLEILGTFLLSGLDFVVILVLFHHLPHLAGWSLPEVAFLYGSSYVVFKVADVAVGNIDKLPELIRTGEFDAILTRPLGSLPQALIVDFDVHHVGGAAQGAAVFGFALSRLDLAWTPTRVAVLVAMLASGFAIFCSVWIASNAIAFWLTDAREVANAATYGGNFLTQFPLQIYGVWLRRVLAFAVPLAFVNYFPALYLLDKPDPFGLPRALAFASPLVAAVAAIVTAGVWRTAVRRYRSTGS